MENATSNSITLDTKQDKEGKTHPEDEDANADGNIHVVDVFGDAPTGEDNHCRNVSNFSPFLLF